MNRIGVLPTDGRIAKNFCKRTDIAHFDIKGILMDFYKEKVLKEEEIRSTVKDNEERGNTRIKWFEEILSEMSIDLLDSLLPDSRLE